MTDRTERERELFRKGRQLGKTEMRQGEMEWRWRERKREERATHGKNLVAQMEAEYQTYFSRLGEIVRGYLLDAMRLWQSQNVGQTIEWHANDDASLNTAFFELGIGDAEEEELLNDTVEWYRQTAKEFYIGIPYIGLDEKGIETK